MKILATIALCLSTTALAVPAKKSPFLAPEVNGVERISGTERLEVKKAYDGKVAVCDSKAHVGYQAYRLKVVKTGGSSANLRLTNLVCVEEGGQFTLKPSQLIKQLPNGLKVSDTRILVTDENYRVVADVPVGPTAITTDFTVEVGRASQIRWTAFVRSILSYQEEGTYDASGTFNIIL